MMVMKLMVVDVEDVEIEYCKVKFMKKNEKRKNRPHTARNQKEIDKINWKCSKERRLRRKKLKAVAYSQPDFITRMKILKKFPPNKFQ